MVNGLKVANKTSSLRYLYSLELGLCEKEVARQANVHSNEGGAQYSPRITHIVSWPERVNSAKSTKSMKCR